jgi:N-acetyltransferase 10
MSMDCHARFRTEAHQTVVPRFNERFILSLSHCNACLVLDDELNLLPLSSKGTTGAQGLLKGSHVDASCSAEAVAAAVESNEAGGKELAALVRSLADAQPAGTLASMCKTLDQVRRDTEPTHTLMALNAQQDATEETGLARPSLFACVVATRGEAFRTTTRPPRAFYWH